MNANDLNAIFDVLFKAVIGGCLVIGFYWVMKLRRDQSKPDQFKPSQRKIQLLEEISANVGRVNHCFAKYSALVIESTKFGPRWPPTRKKELEKVNSELVYEFEKLSNAEATLLMLGEKTMEKTLRLYGAKIALFRKHVYVGREDITEQEIADIKGSIMQLRERFYDILSNRYDRLLTA